MHNTREVSICKEACATVITIPFPRNGHWSSSVFYWNIAVALFSHFTGLTSNASWSIVWNVAEVLKPLFYSWVKGPFFLMVTSENEISVDRSVGPMILNGSNCSVSSFFISIVAETQLDHTSWLLLTLVLCCTSSIITAVIAVDAAFLLDYSKGILNASLDISLMFRTKLSFHLLRTYLSELEQESDVLCERFRSFLVSQDYSGGMV